MKTSLVVTVYNEKETIKNLIASLIKQTKKPDEILIVDGGSTDKTVEIINHQLSTLTNYKKIFKVLIKKGNRSVGRNFGIKKSGEAVILITDAGCILDKNWVKNISRPFKDTSVSVVAGYYKGKALTVFQKCLIPYVLIMPDRVNPSNFLPSTRSMAIKKTVWKNLHGFDEQYSHNEDYVFARKLQKKKIPIYFEKSAIVYWIPRNNIVQAFWMFFRFATGDIEAGIIRPKVFFIFLRYCLIIYILLFTGYRIKIPLLIVLILTYIIWAIQKNFKYVRQIDAIYSLPLIQVVSDVSIILGSLYGVIRFICTRLAN